MNGKSTEHLANIRAAIGRTFTLSELRSLAFDLGVDIENFITALWSKYGSK